MEVVLFRIRTREHVDQEEYARASAHMVELVRQSSVSSPRCRCDKRSSRLTAG